jgi:hypothetical protein
MAIIIRVNKFFFLPFVFIFFSSCLMMPFGDEQGVCRSGDQEINTYKLPGVWKKDEANNSINFKLMNFEKGPVAYGLPPEEEINGEWIVLNNRMCEKYVGQDVTATVTRVGLYHHHSSQRAIRLRHSNRRAGNVEREEWVQYAFSGSCGGTKLWLKYEDNRIESYSFYALSAQGACDLGQ